MDYVPYLHCHAGDLAFVRATILETCSDAFKVRFEDYPRFICTQWVPATEVARAADIGLLRPIRRVGLKRIA